MRPLPAWRYARRAVPADPRTETIDTIRALAMDAVQKANAGHPGTAMALAPLAYLLYRDVMRHNPADPHWPGRDRFVLSAGHACILQYASLHLAGYDLTLDDLKEFRQWGSRTPGHPEHGHTAGVETTTGPLGQGFANGVGMAISQRFLADRYNRPHHEIVDSWIYAICSDGDMMEGLSSEAASIAGHLGLGRLVYVYDDNHITIDGTTSLTFTTEDKGKRFEAYGWHVQHVDDSEDLDALLGALAAAKAEEERPSLIVLRSHIAYPAPHAIDTGKSHGSPLGEAEVRATKEIMGFDPDATFAVSDAVREHMAVVAERGAELQREWDGRLAAWAGAFPELAQERELDLRGEPREGWREALPVFPAGEEVATRDAGRTVMQALKPFTPTMVGGSADLVESNKTEFEGAGIFSALHAGRNIAFGIREHAMGSIVNGIALEPAMLRPYGSTFLIFSDYMRPAVRLSALMGLAHGLGLDARLDRRRRGRPDAPARRAPHGAPGDPEPLVRPPRRRQRDLDGVADRARAAGRPRRARADAAEAADLRPERGRAGERCPARRLHAVAARRGRARGDRDRDGQRGTSGARGGPVARGERAGRLDAVLGALRRAGRRLPGLRAAARRRDAGGGRGRRHARLGALRKRHHRYRPFRCVGALPADLRRVRDHGRGDRRHDRGRAAVRIAAAFDHRGIKLRDAVLEAIEAAGHEAVDLGTDTDAVRIDYPDKALELGMAIRRGEVDRGVLVCGSGVGASVAASKIPGIRAAICHDTYSAHQGVEHDDMNVLCLGSEIVGGELTRELVHTFLGARFIGGGRYADRLEKVAELERMSDG